MDNFTNPYNFTTATSENSTQLTENIEFACKTYDLIMNLVVKLLLLGLGCVGNALSIAVMWGERKVSATSFLLIMLAVADTLLLFTWILCVTFPGMIITIHYTVQSNRLKESQIILNYLTVRLLWKYLPT